ncbi:MAG: MBL fold metallo-hydrolase [Cyclobacteriaceae bacterium]
MSSLEIDFLAVGTGERSGDAIAIRYGDFIDKQKQYVIVIDGGTVDSGKELIKLIKETYGTYYIDLIILTHPDGDHSSGLREILRDEEFTIAKFWMHQPWEHSEEIKNLFKDGRITSTSLSERLKDAYNFAYECEEIAKNRDIPIEEPFTGKSFNNGNITVLGPDEDYYTSLIPEFNKSPEQKTSTFSKALTGISEAINWVIESMTIETLDESSETSGENSSSAVILLKFAESSYLFTADTGVDALKRVLDYADLKGINLKDIQFMQIPHHGSQRNISPSILDAITPKYALASASKDAPKHPSKKVTNAYKRRGTKTYATNGTNVRVPNNAPSREGYSTMDEVPFYNQVEE